LTDNHTLEEIKEEAIIFIFLPLPDMGSTKAREPSAAQANHLENPPSNYQIFVHIPDIWSLAGRKPAYIQTMPVPLTLGSLKQGLSQLLSLSTFWFRIQYGGKILTHDRPLKIQGIGKNVRVSLLIGGL